MYWLEFAGSLVAGSVFSGACVVVRYRGWRYFARLKFIGRKPERKPLSLEMRVELGSDMEMAEWDEEFRRLAEPIERAKAALEWERVQAEIVRRTVELELEREAARLAEKAQEVCVDCEYAEQRTYADRHVRRLKIWSCPECLQRDRRRAELVGREMLFLT